MAAELTELSVLHRRKQYLHELCEAYQVSPATQDAVFSDMLSVFACIVLCTGLRLTDFPSGSTSWPVTSINQYRWKFGSTSI